MQDSSVLDAVVFRKATNSPVDDERAKRALIRAVTVELGNFRYDPSIENGQIIEMEGVTTRITFKLELRLDGIRPIFGTKNVRGALSSDTVRKIRVRQSHKGARVTA